MTRPKMSVQRRKLARYVAQLQALSNLTARDRQNIEAARQAMADYDALPEHLKEWAK